ncbi:Acetyl-/propionyl-coenzyme A carboxylase alpha chain [Microbulbifer aggregans]|uniref:Biotin carboxylase n=1 Tax=Microbulbifer aggregans TaxID=1769779 RepID=A0A1C9WAE2_9GAMM|nr:biotin carboxylase N-terminal domain-containing protein [Microbulbifer aggregans]AOS98120.1 Acetyl-/propionyl-coenzyme A carboxylase alpha chain [Microbulbifer aggregans]
MKAEAQENRPGHERPTLLVANRGEIAARIIRTARAQGYRTIAIYSDADADSPHVQLADSAIAIGGRTPAESYLDIERVLAAADQGGARAVHPGYGFLSENAEFACACVERGLVFVGPAPDTIELMGNKRRAKSLAESAGVPGIPGYSGEQTDDALLKAALEIGFPIMIKATDGGGGRGMRLVRDRESFADQLRSARSEASAAFGSDEVILEKAIFSARHIEVQVFADTKGTVVHLGERDCSLQRRHQKIIEESPSPAVDPALRARLGDAAKAVASACHYVGAGTVEFLLDDDGNFYFLEMNTRLQVEHPVTEMVSGFDLVAWQLLVSRGDPLPADQVEIDRRLAQGGHAIEARLYAEDPANGFLPQSGRILHWQAPTGDGIRVDSGICTGQLITPFYDPMLGKLIAWGEDREQARLRLLGALQAPSFVGPAHNFSFLCGLASSPDFTDGLITTDYLDRAGTSPESSAPSPGLVTVAATLLHEHSIRERDRRSGRANWRTASDDTPLLYRLETAGEVRDCLLWPQPQGHYRVECEAETSTVTILHRDADTTLSRVELTIGSRRSSYSYLADGDLLHLLDQGTQWRFSNSTQAPASNRAPATSGQILAPMDGCIIEVHTRAGARVARGETLAVMEAMKMEHPLKAACDGEVIKLAAGAGDQVRGGQLLVEIEAAIETDSLMHPESTE